MRIAIGQLWQETNTLNPISTTRSDFEEFGVCRGNELVEQMARTNELGGFIQSLRKWPERPEIVGRIAHAVELGEDEVPDLDLAELHQFELAAKLSASLIRDWLIKYKFKDWDKTETRGVPKADFF